MSDGLDIERGLARELNDSQMSVHDSPENCERPNHHRRA